MCEFFSQGTSQIFDLILLLSGALSYFFQEPAIGFYDFFVNNKVGLKELAVRISVTIRNSILTELFSGIYVIFKWHR